MRVLVTRPRPQGEELCAEIRAAGGEAIYFPVIDIKPAKDTVTFEKQISGLNEYDWVIFVSPRAVFHSVVEIKKQWPVLPEKMKIAAIGAMTAEALHEAGLSAAIYPEEEWNSEGLLELPEFKEVKDKKIAIVCGESGRDLLQNELTARGASVTRIVSYQRALPKREAVKQDFDIVVCTSVECIDNYKTLFGSTNKPLVIVSERLKKHAEGVGFKKIFLAKNASTRAIVDELTKLKLDENDPSRMQNEMMEAVIKKEQARKEQKIKESKQKKTFPWGMLSFLFSLITLSVVFYLSYFYLMNNSKNAVDQVSEIKDQLQQIQQNDTALQQQAQKWSEEVKNQSEIIATLKQSQTNHKVLLAMLEAQYLVKIANDDLQYSNNAARSLKLLKLADQALQDVSSDSGVNEVRQALATDIAALQAVPQVDVVGLYARLSALNQQIDKLPLPAKATPASEQATSTEEQTLPWWKRGLHQMWGGLSKIVVVRYHDKGSLPLVTPEQQDFLYQNMHAMLEKTMWGLLHEQPEIFQASLQQQLDWTKKYFIQDSPVTQAVIKDLNDLLQVNVRPDIPKTLSSMAALQNYFSAHS